MPKVEKKFDMKQFIAGYSRDLASQRQKIADFFDAFTLEQKTYKNMQELYIERYKQCIVRKFMGYWTKSDKFPKDDELTNAIFHLAGLELEPGTKKPDITTHLDSKTYSFKLMYYNDRLKKYIELKP